MHTHPRSATHSSLTSVSGQVSSLTLSVRSPLSLLAISHVVQHPLSSSGGANWARFQMFFFLKAGCWWAKANQKMMLYFCVSFSLDCCNSVKKKKKKRGNISSSLLLVLSVAWCHVSLSRRRMERLRGCRGGVDDGALCHSHARSWSLCTTHPPVSLSPMTTFIMYSGGIIPPFLPPSCTVIIIHLIMREGWMERDWETEGFTSDDKVVPPEIKHLLWCSF